MTDQHEPDLMDLMAEKHAEAERIAYQAGTDQAVAALFAAAEAVARRIYEQRVHKIRVDPNVAFCVGVLVSCKRMNEKGGGE